jgi:hypothetical protein
LSHHAWPQNEFDIFRPAAFTGQGARFSFFASLAANLTALARRRATGT